MIHFLEQRREFMWSNIEFPYSHKERILKHGKTIYLIFVLVQKYSAAIFPISMGNYVASLGQTLNIILMSILTPTPQAPIL